MKTNFECVAEFHKACDVPVRVIPVKIHDLKSHEFRLSLIREELKELEDGVAAKDIVEISDALTDLLYVIYGYGHTIGVDLDKTFAEVHRSNMTKVMPDGKVIKREDGKILKPSNYSPPDLYSILFPQE